ncbi:MAG: sulfurtransferase TusA family protein [Magnetospirillum sp. WYHS-4]
MAETYLDTKGMNCPLPILKTKKTIKSLANGDTVKVESTDPGSVKDFEAFCRSTGNKLVSSTNDGGVYTYVIEKAG